MSKRKKTKTPGPSSPEEAQQLAQAQAARKQGVADVARTLLERLIAGRPDFAAARYELALTFISAEDYEAAENHLRMIVRHTPGMRDAWISLALINHRLRRAANEIECLRRAVAITTDARLVRRLFELYRDGGNHQAALQMLEALRELEDSPRLALEILEQQERLGRKDLAVAGYASLMETVPAPVQAVEQWARLLMDQGLIESVIERLSAMIAQGRREAVFYLCLGRAYTLSERTRDAIEAYTAAVGMDPSHTGWWHDLSVVQRQMGDMKGSQASLVRALTLDPYNAAALRVHGVEHKYQYGDDAFRRLNAAHALFDKYTPPGKAQLHNALAKAYEDVEELDTAFKHYEEGGQLQTRLDPYRHGKVVSLFKLMAFKLKRFHYEDIQRTGYPSDKPVFVFGMPRSGTSLVEQIISSHPEAYGAGELKLLHRVVDGLLVNGMTIRTKEQAGSIQTYIPGVSLNCDNLDSRRRGERYVQAIEAVAGAPFRKVVDKMPGNYYWTGLIPLILPNA
ncbi:MAG: sulfotransferase, partial [Desulfobacteraceae bacterium]|nr:sulfotransferase [Desulfobacteraceae bacterium]